MLGGDSSMSRIRIRKPTFVVLCLLLALVVLSLALQSAVAAPMHPAQASPGGSTSPATGANATEVQKQLADNPAQPPIPLHTGDVLSAPAATTGTKPADGSHLPYKLAVFYALPSDVPFDQRVLDRIKATALDIQAWYQVATGGLTWEWAYPEIVRVYQGENTREYYTQNGNWWGSLLPEMGNAGLPIWEPGVVTGIWAHGAGGWAGAAQGCGIDCGNALLGVELFPEFNNPSWTGYVCPDPSGHGGDAWPCTPEGAFAHELGHTLGLGHPFDDSVTAPYAFHSLMQTHWNYPNEAVLPEESPWGFLTTERQHLRTNPFMKPGIGLVQQYQDADLIVNLPVSGAAPLAAFEPYVGNSWASFENTTQGASLYFWTFGDYTTADATSPTHRYESPGIYTATLRASSDQSMMSVMSRTLVFEKASHEILLPFIVNGAGTGQGGQILYTSAPSWDQPHDVYAMNDDGANVRRLTNGPGSSVDGRFSPDGAQIVFASDRTGSWFVYTMSADGTNVKQLAPAMAWGECSADWSPDGRQIAYVCSTGGICVMNADGTHVRQLTSAYDRFPKWSHDGTKLAYDRFVGGSFTWNYDVFVMNADGSNQANMTNHPDTSDCMPDWSPDDSKITFTRWSTPYLEYVYVMKADGSDAHPITGDAYNSHSVWSPDGARIVFHSGQAGMLKNVFVMNADGSNPTRLTYRDDWPTDWWAALDR